MRRVVAGARFADELTELADVLAASHAAYAWEAWALPTPADRPDRLRALYRADLELVAAPHGAIWATDDLRSVAVWVPSGTYARLDQRAIDALDRVATAAFGDRLDAVDAAEMAIRHARPAADWHLATMGTRPEHQGRGLGAAVLAAMVDHLDADGLTATLETSSDANVRFYGRHGFDVVATVAPPGGAPTTYVMHRRPA